MAIHDPSLLVPYFDYIESNYVLSGTAQRICTSNANRVALIFSNTGFVGGHAFIGTLPSVTQSTGYLLPASVAPWVVRFADVGALTTFAWFASSNSNPVLKVGEVIFRPGR